MSFFFFRDLTRAQIHMNEKIQLEENKIIRVVLIVSIAGFTIII